MSQDAKVAELKETAEETIARLERERDEAIESDRESLEMMRRMRERLEAELATEAHRADSMLDRCRELEAQLTALAAEHESAARAAETLLERIASYAADAAAFRSEDAGGPLSIIEHMARAALAEVKP